MKLRNPRPALQTLALAVAFVSGWALCSPVTSESSNPTRALHRGLERDTTRHSPGTGTPSVNPAPARAVETGLTDNPLIALKSFALPGAAATPLERLQMLAEYGTRDPQTALTYVDTLPAAERAGAAATVMGAWAARDPQAAAAHLETGAGGFGLADKEASAAAAAVAMAWTRQNPAAALAWAAGLSDDLRSAALEVAIGAQTAADPAAARQLFGTLDDPAVRAEAATPLASQWAAHDPGAAAAWAVSLPAPEERAAALAGVTTAWMSTDPGAASRWVNALPAGTGKDAAIVALAAAPSIRNDPEASLIWARSLTAPDLRERITAAIAGRIRLQQSIP